VANVKSVYLELLKQGYTKKDAAKEAQARTGMSAVTGSKIKDKLKFNKKTGKVRYGQYGV